jgi:L-fucose isomerase-like protein
MRPSADSRPPVARLSLISGVKIGVIGSGNMGAADTVMFPNDRLERMNDERRFVDRALVLDQDVPEQGGSK